MFRRLCFVDNKLSHAVINCDFAAVKRILDSGIMIKNGLMILVDFMMQFQFF